MRIRTLRRGRNEQGATLILALVFLVVVGLVAGSLVQWAGGDLTATSQFTSAHSNESAANGANAIAVQFVRYNFLSSSLFASPPAPCWPTASGSATFSLSPTGPTVASWCSTNWSPLSQNSRVVTISTCPVSITTLAANCAANPYLQTTVTIDDVSATSGITSCSPVLKPVSNTGRTCGQHLTVNSWAFGVSPPTVSSVAMGVATNCGTSQSIVITGTGIGQASQVYFLEGNPPAAAFVASKFSVSSATTVNACTPSTSIIPSGTAYVVVQTPTGSNWYGPGPPSSPTASW